MEKGGKEMSKRSTVTLPKGEYLREHVRLVKILRNPTAASLKAEAKRQAEDIVKARRSKG